MPNERSNRSASFEARSRASPFPCSSSRQRNAGSSSSGNTPDSLSPPQSPAATAKDIKEWDDILCPICMEHPHNAVLLICTSSNKGCRPFMCDTSHHHSNCLDQYRRTFSGSSSSQANDAGKPLCNLPCPLCRGQVTGLTIVEPARRYMNSKLRSCSSESCPFSGDYGDLRKHARMEHPSVRPWEVDPERQRDWIRMEQQRDIGDLISMMQSAMGGEGGGIRGFPENDYEINVIYHHLTVNSILRFHRFHRQGGMVNGQTAGRSARVPSRSRRGSPSILSGESVNNNPNASGRIVHSSNGGDDDNADGLWGDPINYNPNDSVTRIVYSSSSGDDDDDGDNSEDAVSRRSRGRLSQQAMQSDDVDVNRVSRVPPAAVMPRKMELEQSCC